MLINLVINTVKEREVSGYGFILADLCNERTELLEFQLLESSVGRFLLKT